MAVLADHFLRHEQEDIRFDKDGPLHPAVHYFVKSVTNEESINRAREYTLQKLDTQSKRVSSASRFDIHAGESIDRNEVESLLA